MKQFGKILKFELKSFFTNKIFVGITVFLVIAIAVAMFIPSITNAFKKDGEGDQNEFKDVMLLKSYSLETSDIMKDMFSASFPDYKVKITLDEIDVIKNQIKDGEAYCAFVMTSPTEYKYYVENMSLYDGNIEIANDLLRDVYRFSIMLESGMSEEEVQKAINIQVVGDVENLGKDQTSTYFYTYIMIFALYMVILLYGQMVTTNVATEKSSRAMELLITSANPVSMMFGKVLASCIAGLIQLSLVFGSALLFYNINKSDWGDNSIISSIFNIPIELLVYMLVFFVLGFLIYAFLFGAIGSTASKLEDINTSTMPLMFMFVIAFTAVMSSMSSGNVDSTLMKVCSYIPFTSPMAMFTRIAMSNVSFYEIIISIIILISSTIGVGVLSAKIYRVGVLLYGTTPKISSIIKAVWRA